uniref:DUF1120 domain-containing protein n=1 Tax=Serratia marcescens TaxID=615 RepID=UPI0011E6EF65
MNNIIKITALTCMMAATSNSMAAGPAANIKISGSVTVGACVPTLDNNGISDLGDVSVDQIT